MYSMEKKQFIFKQVSGKTWNFFVDETDILLYSNLTRRRTWTEPVKIGKDIHPPFFADMDYNDLFHLFFQDKMGNLYYSKVNDGAMKTTMILNSKQPTPYNKNLFLIPGKSVSHAFYTLISKGSRILAHQQIRGGVAETPKVIDYVPDTNHPFEVVQDTTGNLYAFYQCSDGKHLQTGFKKFAKGGSGWGDFTPVSSHDSNTSLARVITDPRNVLHLIYQRHVQSGFELIYRQKVPDKNLWSSETVLQSFGHPCSTASILWASGSMVVYWVLDDTIHYARSFDEGSRWQAPEKLNFPGGRQLLCMSYKSNHVDEVDRIISPEVPGCFINGYRLAFREPPAPKKESLTPDELRNMIVESLKLMKADLEDLKDLSAGLRSDIVRLDALYGTIEREMVKGSLRLGMLEGDLKTLREQRRNASAEDVEADSAEVDIAVADSAEATDISVADSAEAGDIIEDDSPEDATLGEASQEGVEENLILQDDDTADGAASECDVAEVVEADGAALCEVSSGDDDVAKEVDPVAK